MNAPAETEVQRAARRLIARYKGVRAAARATGLSAACLSRLNSGATQHPGKQVQNILGLRRVTVYQPAMSKARIAAGSKSQ